MDDHRSPSRQLSDEVNKVVAAWLSENGAMLTGFVGYVEYLDDEGSRCWATLYPQDQSTTLTYGQVEMLKRSVRDEWTTEEIS